MEERLQELFRFWDFNRSEIRERVNAVRGDMADERFGLDADAYESLAKECTHIIHCGGVVRMNLPLQEARRIALDASKNICALAEVCRQNGILKKIEFVSTVGVAGKLPGLLVETWDTPPRGFHNTYEQAKAEAEEFIAQKVKEGLPVTVHRPSMVVGASKTGRIIHFQVFYHLCEFLSGRRTFGVVPRLHGVQLDTIPVDYVAEVIVLSSNRSDWAGMILHLCSGPEHAMQISFLLKSVSEIYKKYGKKVPRPLLIPLPLFKAIIQLVNPVVSLKIRRVLNTLPFFFEYLEEKQSFSNEETQKLLAATGMVLPLAEQYLEAVLYYYLVRGKISEQ
jgi:thioester reductase-like protein